MDIQNFQGKIMMKTSNTQRLNQISICKERCCFSASQILRFSLQNYNQNQYNRMKNKFGETSKLKLILNNKNRNLKTQYYQENVNIGSKVINEEVKCSTYQMHFFQKGQFLNRQILKSAENIINQNDMKIKKKSITLDFQKNRRSLNAKLMPKNINIPIDRKNENHFKNNKYSIRNNYLIQKNSKPKMELKIEINQIPLQNFNKIQLTSSTFVHEEIQKSNNQIQRENFLINYSLNKSNLSLVNVISLEIKLKKDFFLTLSQNVINHHIKHQFQSSTKQTSQSHSDRLNNQKILNEKLKFMSQSFKQLSKQIREKQQNIRALQNRQEKIRMQLTVQQNQIKKNHQYLQLMEKQVKNIDDFLYKQPNKILKSQALGYKQKQQQLFDLAFQMEQRTPSFVKALVEEAIVIPRQNFLYTVRIFPDKDFNTQGTYTIDKKQLQQFKKSITTNLQCCINQLSGIIESKTTQITSFVNTMRHLASYTIGKREYLTEINKKMAQISVFSQRQFDKLHKYLEITKQSEQKIAISSIIIHLKDIFKKMKEAYTEAEVFY